MGFVWYDASIVERRFQGPKNEMQWVMFAYLFGARGEGDVAQEEHRGMQRGQLTCTTHTRE